MSDSNAYQYSCCTEGGQYLPGAIACSNPTNRFDNSGACGPAWMAKCGTSMLGTECVDFSNDPANINTRPILLAVGNYCNTGTNMNSQECQKWMFDHHGQYDNLMNSWCSNTDNQNNPLCACINALVDNPDSILAPSCIDNNCQQFGYKTAGMPWPQGQCPAITQTNCNQMLLLEANGTISVPVNQKQQCDALSASGTSSTINTVNGGTSGSSNTSTNNTGSNITNNTTGNLGTGIINTNHTTKTVDMSNVKPSFSQFTLGDVLLLVFFIVLIVISIVVSVVIYKRSHKRRSFE